jgi:hypothetical protein
MVKSAKKSAKSNGTADKPKRGRPRNQDLPGMEDRSIKPLDDVAAAYADVRDQRIALNKEEADLKAQALKLMAKYEKTIYRHDGITITVVDGEPDVKVKIKKPGDDADADDHAELEADGEGAEA